MSGWISSKLKVAETLLQQIDQQAAESLRKNEASRSGNDSIQAAAAANDILPPPPPIKLDQLKKKKKTPVTVTPPPPEKSYVVDLKEVNVNVNPKPSLTDGDWTELLSSSPRVLKKQVVPNLDRKRSQIRRSGAGAGQGAGAVIATAELPAPVNDSYLNEQKKVSSVPDSSRMLPEAESTDSDSTSDSESERQQEEERRKKREQLLAEKAAAKAVEAIKDRENLVARLEGEKQSLEKIIDERAKQQALEASQLQMTMMETMEAVDLEKQKHNNTRMEVLMKLAKLETSNAGLAKSLASAQWSLEEEVKRVAELQRQIALKEASQEVKSKDFHPSGNKPMASRGVELEHEILEAENAFVTDKIGQLQEKAKSLELAIQVTRKEIENPTEVEVELKRRLSQLTDYLIQKQAQVETLSSEKAMLMFKIEAVSRSLDESKSSLKTSSTMDGNDIESGEARLIEKGGLLVRQLDSIFLTFARRNRTGKIWCIVYLVCLHLWVLYIFRSHTEPVSNGHTGAVISLENIHT